MKQFILLVGAQGSGKTTYCVEKLAGCTRVSQDEQGKAYRARLEEALARGDPLVVVDRTNRSRSQRGELLELARTQGYRTRIVWLNADRETCLERTKARAGHQTLGPETAGAAIASYFQELEAPARGEADELVVLGAAVADAVARREEYVAKGLLRSDRTDDGELAIFTYTDKCTYERAWDELTSNSRGHIYHVRTGECAAWAFPKFFNLGENEEALFEKFDWSLPYEVYEKMDGWLGVLYRNGGLFKVASRGSFHSEGAVWGTSELQKWNLSCLPDEVTLLFEIIHPKHRIILDYEGREMLVVLAAFDRRTGKEFARARVEEWATRIGLPIVKRHEGLDIQGILRIQKEEKWREGFVVRFEDGRRLKVKTEWYLTLARILTNLSPISIWGAMRGGKVQDVFLSQIPEELRKLVGPFQETLERQYAAVAARVRSECRPVLDKHGGDRKAIALDRGSLSQLGKQAVFSLLDGREEALEKLVMKAIYPAGNEFVKL